MSNTRLTVQLEGSSTDQGHVRLSELIAWLDAVKDALKETANALQLFDLERHLYFRVVATSHQSPLKITIEAVAPKSSNAQVEAVVRRLFVNLRMISERKVMPKRADFNTIDAYRDMAPKPKSNIAWASLRSGHQDVRIDDQFRDTVKRLLGNVTVSTGSMTGRIEGINIHGRYRFTMYPRIGPARIRGEFDPGLIESFKDSLEKVATVYGRLYYRGEDVHPYRITAEGIALRETSTPLDMLALRGAFPDITGSLTTEEFMDKVRNEDWPE